MTTTDALGRPLTPARRRVERMRRHQRRTMAPSVTVARDDADMTRNPYLHAWAMEMGRRFGPWTVYLDDWTDPGYVTLRAEKDHSRERPRSPKLQNRALRLAAYPHPEHADGFDCDGLPLSTGEVCGHGGTLTV